MLWALALGSSLLAASPEVASSTLADYESARSQAGRDADAQVKLAPLVRGARAAGRAAQAPGPRRPERPEERDGAGPPRARRVTGAAGSGPTTSADGQGRADAALAEYNARRAER